MYSLFRDGDGFGVRRDALAASGGPGVGQPAAPRDKTSRVDYAQWKAFMENGQLTGQQPDEAVLESWRRCRELAVDYTPRSCWDFAPMNQIEPFAAAFRELCADIETKTYAAIKGRNLLITVTDAKGRVARTCGDLGPLRQADKLNFGPGANWAESSVGTNAIGTALTTGKPMQVFGEEHFCRSHHVWSCTAAPIFDPRGEIWGCFDISGPTGSDHSKSLELVQRAAREVEKRLSAIYLAEIEGKFCALVSAVFNSVLTGVLCVNAHGWITNANSGAESLLGKPGRELRGNRIESFFDYDVFLAQQKHNSPQAEPVMIRCHANPGLIARAAPIFSRSGVWTDTVITISEPQRVRPACAGQQALRTEACPAGRETPHGFERVLHQSKAMRQVVQQAVCAAKTPSTVLLTGESGTGKDLIAQGIHQAGPRAKGPFIAVNCGALAGELVQSELFGYCAGAFTGADKKGRIGKFELAEKGVLFLDEIAEMPLPMQVNLLRALEERAVVRVGGSHPVPVDVKVIAATNRDLSALVAEGRFRQDLFYRLNVIGIHIPPLRERPMDVPLLAMHHAKRLCAAFGIAFAGVRPEVLEALSLYDWPGNVRELVNCMEYAVNALTGGTSGGVIRLEHLPPAFAARAQSGPAQFGPAPLAEAAATGFRAIGPRAIGPRAAGSDANSDFRLKDVEAETIREALHFHGGNVRRTARALGIGRNTLYAKLRKFNIPV
ncbi:MAG: sigma-54-dependent Fis family transcriptional regulator [Desulfovibrionaceae bacterium CG1_02_65_16]|nr:MAG: sigma-54-dependent Fis family transcriptional regulator [Desulfovibrionaceae bacterium CG1_02_65_16]